MILYLLEWNNGLDFGDAHTELLGVYTSEEERDAAKVRYTGADHWPFNAEGRFAQYDVQANQDLYVWPRA